MRARAVRLLVLCTVLWGVSFPTMRALGFVQSALVPEAGSWFFASLGVCYRFGLAGLVMAMIYWRRLAAMTRLEWEQGIVLALFGAGGILFQMDGLSYTDASTSAFLTQGYCVFIPLWVALTCRRWPTKKTFVCILLVIAGVAVLAKVNLAAFHLGRGEWETLLASLFFTGQILTLEHPRYAASRPENFSTVMFLLIALLCVPVVVATMPDAGACVRAYASVPACGLLLVLVVFCTLLAYNCMNIWQRHITATEAGLIYCAEPVFASGMALFLPAIFSAWASINYPNEEFTLRLLVGGGLITAANVLLLSPWFNGPRSIK